MTWTVLLKGHKQVMRSGLYLALTKGTSSLGLGQSRVEREGQSYPGVAERNHSKWSTHNNTQGMVTCNQIIKFTSKHLQKHISFFHFKLWWATMPALLPIEIPYMEVESGGSINKSVYEKKNHIQCLVKVFGPLELCDLLPHFRLQT